MDKKKKEELQKGLGIPTQRDRDKEEKLLGSHKRADEAKILYPKNKNRKTDV